MSDHSSVLYVETDDTVANDALSAYLSRELSKSRGRLPVGLAEESYSIFDHSLKRLIARCQTFLEGSADSESHLLLGKVQSGKTAHLLGTLAWTATSAIEFAVVFTGVTGSLDNQTRVRLEGELANLPLKPVRVFSVPPRGKRTEFSAFVQEFKECTNARVTRGGPLPVLVAMKNRARIAAVRAAINEVQNSIGPKPTFLVIDDEADQASQNARARTRGTSTTYRDLASLRGLGIRHLWLSYTATPQAVLLTHRAGALRPDYVAIVPPRPGYFGLTQAMAETFAPNLITVGDWNRRARFLLDCPASLSESVLKFLFVTWVRKNHPEQFYFGAVSPSDLSARKKSCQMLIHESGAVLDHERMAVIIKEQTRLLADLIEDILLGRSPDQGEAELLTRFRDIIESLDRSGCLATECFNAMKSREGLVSLLEIIRDCEVRVINSDPTSISAGLPRPITEDDYELHASWILIGGDILGRGITIPQLTVTYFLRTAQRPNFDTVLQQLRFCGYRGDYSTWTSIYGAQQTFQDLEYMEIVDRTSWERARHWDQEDRKLTGTDMPPVFYAAPRTARFEPTRTNVRDPDIQDRNLTGESLFGLRQIFEPPYLRSNLGRLRTWIDENSLVSSISTDSHEVFEDVGREQLQELFSIWKASDKESNLLSAISDMFDPALGELGLSDIPISMIVSKWVSEAWKSPDSVPSSFSGVPVTRGITKSQLDLSEWTARYARHELLSQAGRTELHVQHVGDGQRKLRDSLDYISTIVIIEPILGLRESRNRSSAAACGLGMAGLKPDGFEIRTIGHS